MTQASSIAAPHEAGGTNLYWRDVPQVEFGLIRAHGLAAVITLFISGIFGAIVALKFTYPDFLGNQAWLTWGRLRYDHTQGILFGWLGNAFLAFLYYSVPRLSDRTVTSGKLGWILFWVWNLGVLIPGWTLMLFAPTNPALWMFAAQPLEWAEFPIAMDALVVLGLLVMAVQFVLPFLRARLPGGLYVSGWYIIGGTIFTLFAYPVGNFVPQWLPGAQGAAFSGLWIHDAVGLFITPFALAIIYFVIPATTRRPIYSHFLSMIGFWVLFFVYPLNGTHHYVYSAIPMDAQKAAIIASNYLGLDVILVVFNQLMSLRGESGLVGRDVALRFVWTGSIFYLIVSVQGALQSLMPVNALTHFTDWVIAHSHLAMLGFATFSAAGGLAHVWARLPNTRYNARAMAWAYWLLTSGLLLMFIDLTAGGLVQGTMWEMPLPWIETINTMRTYWFVRDVSAIPLLLGFVMLFVGMITGPMGADYGTEPQGRAPSTNPAGLRPRMMAGE